MKIICRNNSAQCNARGGNELRDEISVLRYDLLLVSRRRRTIGKICRLRHRSGLRGPGNYYYQEE